MRSHRKDKSRRAAPCEEGFPRPPRDDDDPEPRQHGADGDAGAAGCAERVHQLVESLGGEVEGLQGGRQGAAAARTEWGERRVRRGSGGGHGGSEGCVRERPLFSD